MLTYKKAGETIRLAATFGGNTELDDLYQSVSIAFEITRGGRYFPTLEVPSDIDTKGMSRAPLYGYAHGQVSLQLSPSCPWDSWRIGNIYTKDATPEKIKFALDYNTNILNGYVYSIADADGCYYLYNPAEKIDEFVRSCFDADATDIEFNPADPA